MFQMTTIRNSMCNGVDQRRSHIHGKRGHSNKKINSHNSTNKLCNKLKYYCQQEAWGDTHSPEM